MSFQVGYSPPNPANIVDQIKEALALEAQAASGNYDVVGEALEGANFARVRFINRVTGAAQNIDVRYGERIGGPRSELGTAIDLMYHGGTSRSPIGGQIDPVMKYDPVTGKDVVDTLQWVSPARLLTRALITAVTTNRSLVEVLTTGTERIARRAHNEKDDFGTIPVEGKLMGIPSYAGQSLQSVIGSAVSILVPEDMETRKLVMKSVSDAMARDAIGGAQGLMGYAPRFTAVPRLVRGPFDVTETVLQQQGEQTAVERAMYATYPEAGGVISPKEYKHGQAAVGERREEAIPVDRFGRPVQAGAFNMSLALRGGMWEPGFNRYVSLQSRMPWQQTADITTGRMAAPAKNVIAGLTYIPEAMPFGSGGAMFDPNLYGDISGFAAQQYKHLPLTSITSAFQLFGSKKATWYLPEMRGALVQGGKGTYNLGAVSVAGGPVQEINIPRAARDLRLQGAYLNIAPFYDKISGQFYETREEATNRANVMSTAGFAAKLSAQTGVPVNTFGRATPELVVDYLSSVTGSPKDVGFKAGLAPFLGGPLSVEVGTGATPVRLHQISAEVKSMPMVMGQSFAMQPFEKQVSMVRRLPGIGGALADWMVQKYPSGGMTDIAEIATQYGALSGGGGNWLEFSKALLGTFQGDPYKMQTLRQYGIAYVDRPQWIRGDVISQGEMIEYQNAQRAMVQARLAAGGTITAGKQTFTGTGQAEEAYNALFRYTESPTPLPKSQPPQYLFEYFSNRGLIAPVGTQYAPEMTGWGMLNYRQIAALTRQFPQTAQMMGLTATSPSVGPGSDPAKVAWSQIKKWEAYDLEARQGFGALPHPEDTSFITPTDAAKIYAATYAGGESFAELSDKAKLAKVQESLSSVMGKRFSPESLLFFSAVPGVLPGPGTMRGIESFEGVTNESASKFSVSWMGAFEKLLQAQMSGEGGYTPTSPALATAALGPFRSMMRGVLESGTGVAKSVFGYDAPGMIFSRYSGMSFLQPGEVFLPQGEVARMISAIPNLSRAERTAMARRLTGGRGLGGVPNLNQYEQDVLAKAYLPGFMLRQPDVSGEYGVMPAKIITEHQLAARGIAPETIKRMRGFVSAGVSSMFSALGVGDIDRDPMQVFLAMRGGKTLETPEMLRYYTAYEKAQVAMAGALGTTDTFGALQQIFGDETSAQHITRATVTGYLEAMGGESSGALGKGMQGQRMPYESYINMMRGWGSSKFGMGRVYNLQRMLESSRSALGMFPEKGFVQNVFDPLQTLYQKAIDFELDEKVAMLNAVNTARVYEPQKGQYALGFSLYGMDNPDPTKMNWLSTMVSGQNPAARTTLRALVNAFGKESYIRDITLGSIFAPSSEAAQGNIAALQELRRLQEAEPEKWGKVSRQSVLMGDVNVPGFTTEVGERSIYYNALMANATARSLGMLGNPGGKYDPIIEEANKGKESKIQLPYRGQTLSLAEIANKPEVYLTNMMMGYQTLEGTSHRAGQLIQAIGKFREIAGGPLTQEVIQGLPVGAQAFLSNVSLQLGEKNFRTLAEKPGSIDISQRYLTGANTIATNLLRKRIEQSLGRGPMYWASDLSAHFAEKPWNTLEKIVGGNIGLRGAEVSGLAVPGTRNLLEAIYPIAPEKAAAGEAFERGWRSPFPDTRSGNIGQSLKFQYMGAEIHAKPDYLSYDPGTGALNVIELKATRNALYGGYQAALGAIGIRELQKTPEGVATLVAKFKQMGYDDQTAAQMAGSQNIGAFYVGAAEGYNAQEGTLAYTDPQAVDINDVEQRILQPGIRGLNAVLANKPEMAKVVKSIVRTARGVGLMDQPTIQSLGKIFGMEQPIGVMSRTPAESQAAFQTAQDPVAQVVRRAVGMGFTPEQYAKALAPVLRRELKGLYSFTGPRKDIEQARMEAEAAFHGAGAISGGAKFERLRTGIAEGLAPILGVSAGEILGGGDLSLLAYQAYQADPVATERALAPYARTLSSFGTRYKSFHAAVKSDWQVANLGVDLGRADIQPGAQVLLGGEGAAQQAKARFDQLYGVSRFAQAMDIKGTTVRGGGGAPVDPMMMMLAMGGFVQGNINQMGALGTYREGLERGLPKLQLLELEQQFQRASLQSGFLGKNVAVEQARYAYASKFGPAPQSLEEISQLIAQGGLAEGQPKALLGLKSLMDKRELAGLQLSKFEAGTRAEPDTQAMLKTGTQNLGDYRKALGELNKELEKGIRNTEETTRAEHDIGIVRSKIKEQITGQQIARTLGEPWGDTGAMDLEQRVSYARDLRGRAQVRLAELRSRPQLTSIEAAEATQLEGLIDQSLEGETGTLRAAAISKSLRGPGAFFRRALGGFGFLYLSHMAGMIGGTAGGTGYAQSLAQQEMITQGLGAQLGGIAPPLSPDEYVSRLEATYGGAGQRTMRMARATLLREAPGVVGLGETAWAGMLGYAGAQWLGSISQSSAWIGKAAPAIAATAAGFSLGMGYLGYALNPEQTAIAVASRYAAGTWSYGQMPGGAYTGRPNNIWSALTVLFDKPIVGTVLNSLGVGDRGVATEQTHVLEMLRQGRLAGQQTDEVFARLGISDKAEKQRYLQMYSQVQLAEYPNIPAQGIIGVQALELGYGFQLPKGLREQAMAAIGQGVPQAETTQAMLGATGWGLPAQGAAFGGLFTGLTGTPLRQLNMLQAGAQRFRALGPYAIAPQGADLQALYGQYAGLDERAYDVVRQSYALGTAQYALGMQPSSMAFMTPTQLPSNLTREQYATMLRQITAQQYATQIGGGLLAQQMAPWLTPEVSTRIAQQYGITNMGAIGAYVGAANVFQQYGGNLQAFAGIRGGQVVSFADAFGQLANQFGPVRMPMLTNLVQPLLQAGMPVTQMDAAMSIFGRGMAGLTNRQFGLGMQILGGDLGAASFASWNQPQVLGTLGMSVAGNRFFTQAGQPIYETGGRDFMNLMAARGINFQLPGGPMSAAFMTGGARGMQWALFNQQWETQQAQWGIQGQQLDISRQQLASQQWYQQASWPLENRQRQLQYQAQMANFAYQGQRMELSNRYAIEQEGISWQRLMGQQNMSNVMADINRQQFYLGRERQQWQFAFARDTSMTQRGWTQQDWSYDAQMRAMQQGWTREDWAYNEQMRNMQFGWNMQDINEAIRYSHGRERKRLVRQRERMGIQFGLEGEQIETQETRQETLWQKQEDAISRQIARQQELWEREDEQYVKEKEYMEAIMRLDERSFSLNEENRRALLELDIQQFELNKRQREEFYKLELENFERQKKDYKEQYDVQTKLIKVQREYQEMQVKFHEEQLDLQEKSIDLQKQLAEQQHEYDEIMRKVQENWNDLYGKLSEINKYDNVSNIMSALGRMITKIDDVDSFTVSQLTAFIRELSELDPYVLTQLIEAIK